MAAKGSALPEATYDAVYGNKKGMPMRPRSARSPNRPFSAGRRTPASSERPRTAGRTASHITVATQDVQKPGTVLFCEYNSQLNHKRQYLYFTTIKQADPVKLVHAATLSAKSPQVIEMALLLAMHLKGYRHVITF